MCLAIPGKVLSVKGKQARVDFNGIQKDVFLGAVKPKVDDYVLVGSGIVVQIIDKKDAINIVKEWEKPK
jgi:hydrogenase expression/formation protein HypC